MENRMVTLHKFIQINFLKDMLSFIMGSKLMILIQKIVQSLLILILQQKILIQQKKLDHFKFYKT